MDGIVRRARKGLASQIELGVRLLYNPSTLHHFITLYLGNRVHCPFEFNLKIIKCRLSVEQATWCRHKRQKRNGNH